MVKAHPTRGIRPAVLLMALLSCACPRPGLGALPPATPDEPSGSAGMGAPGAPQEQPSLYALVPLRWGGSVGYGLRRNSGDDGSASQQLLTTTLSAAVDLPIW